MTSQQDVLYDADGTLTVLYNLAQILLQVGHDIFHILTVVFRQLLCIVFYDVRQVANQFFREFAEIDDEVQRILNLMGYSCAQRAKRRQFLLLLQLLL